MSAEFVVIREEFDADVLAINELLSRFLDPETANPKARVAAVNSAMLLLGATFEEFVREIAKVYARHIVASMSSIEELPPKFLPTAWKRTIDSIADLHKVFKDSEALKDARFREQILNQAAMQFDNILQFTRGDLSKDVYQNLIHNENNMRPGEINSLFNTCGHKNICKDVSGQQLILDLFDETNIEKAHALLVEGINDFFTRRNQIAHSLGTMRSSGHDMVAKDVRLLKNFSQSLCDTLIASARAGTSPSQLLEASV